MRDLIVVMKRQHLETGTLLAQTKGLLRRFDLRMRKELGQHFLIDEGVLRLVISAAELTPTDVIKELARQAGWVIAIELDNKLATVLKQDLVSFDNVTIINADILQIEPAVVLQEQKAGFPPTINTPLNYKVVANLPYYITSAVLRHFLEASIKPQIMVVMVQKEIAEAIVAEPGQMSVLSVSVQLYGEPRIISYVPARCFYPAPKVDSAILRVELYPQPAVAVTDESSFFKLVRAGFSASRKQIVNSLTQGLGLPKAEVLPLLEKVDIVPQRRAETLTLDEWARLWQVFIQAGESTC